MDRRMIGTKNSGLYGELAAREVAVSGGSTVFLLLREE